MRQQVGMVAITLMGAFALAVLAGILPMGFLSLENSRIVEANRHELQPAYEVERETPQTEIDPLEATKNYVNEAIRRYREDPEAALAYYRSEESFVNDPPGLYLLLLDQNTIKLNPVFSAAEGTRITWRDDPVGNRYGAKLAAADEDGIVVEYLIPIPSQNYTYRKKSAWTIRANVPDIDNPGEMEDLIFSAGWLDLEGDVESTFTEQQKAVAAVIEARARIQAETLARAISHYKSPDSIDSEIYVWLAAPRGNIVADATMPELVGQNIADAYPKVGQEILAVEDFQSRWISHMWQNPATGQEEPKHSYVFRFLTFYIVSGYYGGTPPPTSADPCIMTIDGAGTFTGNWEAGSSCLSENRPSSDEGGKAGADYYASFYTFTLDQVSDVIINLTSNEDTYLYLLKGSGRDGAIVDSNDDDSDSKNSRIKRSLDAGAYTIEATTYAPETEGNFTLAVEITGDEQPPSAGEYIAISSGANHVCAIAANGSIMCWGNDDGDSHGQVSNRPTSGRFTQLSSGDNHTCALREDGTLICWGSIEVP